MTLEARTPDTHNDARMINELAAFRHRRPTQQVFYLMPEELDALLRAADERDALKRTRVEEFDGHPVWHPTDPAPTPKLKIVNGPDGDRAYCSVHGEIDINSAAGHMEGHGVDVAKWLAPSRTWTPPAPKLPRDYGFTE